MICARWTSLCESSYLGVPCLLMRRATERREGLDANVVLSHYDPSIIAEFINDADRYRCPPPCREARASEIIVDHATRYLELSNTTRAGEGQRAEAVSITSGARADA